MTPTRQRALITGLIIIGIIIVGFFGLRTFHAFRKFRGHHPPPFPPAGAESAETDVELIRDWMTVPFISKTYRLPPNLLYETLDIPPAQNEEKSLKQLNQQYYPQEDGMVLEKVKAAIRAYQSSLPPQTIGTAVPPSTAIPPQP